MKNSLILLFASTLTACGPSIVGEWELDRYDGDAFEEMFEEEDASLEDIAIDWSFSIDENLEGDAEFDMSMELSSFNEGVTYHVYFITISDGVAEAKETERGYNIEFSLSGTERVQMPVLEQDETFEFEDSTQEVNCSLSLNTLTCEDDDDIGFIFTK